MDARYCKFSGSEIKTLSEQLLDNASDDDLKWLIIWSLVKLGITGGEIAKLQRKDVIWKRNTLKVASRGKIRIIPIDDIYKDRLNRYLSSRTDNNLALFVKKTCKAYYVCEIRQLLESMCKRIGLLYPIDIYFCKCSSIIYFLHEGNSAGKSLTETANILGFYSITKLLFFMNNVGLTLPNLLGEMLSNDTSVPISEEINARVTELKRKIMEG